MIGAIETSTGDRGLWQRVDPPQASPTPMQMVLEDATLSDAEKRNILASWASDQHAVPDQPGLRALDDGTIVLVDDILAALKALDRDNPSVSPYDAVAQLRTSVRRRLSSSAWWGANRRSRRYDDDDDDPPPCPAGSTRPLGPSPMGGSARALAEVC